MSWDVCENRWNIRLHDFSILQGCPPVCNAPQWCWDSEAMRHLLGHKHACHLWTHRRTHNSAYIGKQSNGEQILDESSVLGASEHWAHCPCQAHAAAYLVPLAYQKPRRNRQVQYDFCSPHPYTPAHTVFRKSSMYWRKQNVIIRRSVIAQVSFAQSMQIGLC